MLTLIFGGASQGKSDYIRALIGDKSFVHFILYDEKEPQRLLAMKPEELSQDAVWLEGFERLAELAAEEEKTAVFSEIHSFFTRMNKKWLIIEMCECGCGIVPVTAAERLQREFKGELLRLSAAAADRADRVMAGCGICLKGEPYHV